MTIDRRLRSASNELREVEFAVPKRVPTGTRSPTLALPALMLVFGAALAVTGLDRTPGSEPVPESAAVALQSTDAASFPSSPSSATGPTDAVLADGSYDIESELQLIRELQRRQSPTGPMSAATMTVAAPDANAELELINALVSRPSTATFGTTASDAPAGSSNEVAPSRPIAGFS